LQSVRLHVVSHELALKQLQRTAERVGADRGFQSSRQRPSGHHSAQLPPAALLRQGGAYVAQVHGLQLQRGDGLLQRFSRLHAEVIDVLCDEGVKRVLGHSAHECLSRHRAVQRKLA
jgi:hypothetical protein